MAISEKTKGNHTCERSIIALETVHSQEAYLRRDKEFKSHLKQEKRKEDKINDCYPVNEAPEYWMRSH